MKKRSDIDWANPPEPGSFAVVTLGKAPGKPAVINPHAGLVLLTSARAKKGPALWLPTLIYYVRAACLLFPVFREELEDMLAKLPSTPPEAA